MGTHLPASLFRIRVVERQSLGTNKCLRYHQWLVPVSKATHQKRARLDQGLVFNDEIAAQQPDAHPMEFRKRKRVRDSRQS